MTIHVAGLQVAVPVLLAPMAGITDLPFRRLVARFGAGLVTSEMVASQEMVQANPATRARAATGDPGVPYAVQLAGREPRWMGEAARLAEADGALAIDINMGCPAKKVTGGLSGAALLREPDRALRMIEAVVAAVRVPVTLKTRLGWDGQDRSVRDFLRRAVAAGIAMITLHGRTRSQFYKGAADWAAIGRTGGGLGVPLIANGDIRDAAASARALALSGASGVMVGRAAQGAPWRLRDIAAGLSGSAVPAPPSGAALCDLVIEHHADMLSFYGPELGLRVARKHLGWYMAWADTPTPLRREVLTADSVARVHRLLPTVFGTGAAVAA